MAEYKDIYRSLLVGVIFGIRFSEEPYNFENEDN